MIRPRPRRRVAGLLGYRDWRLAIAAGTHLPLWRFLLPPPALRIGNWGSAPDSNQRRITFHAFRIPHHLPLATPHPHSSSLGFSPLLSASLRLTPRHAALAEHENRNLEINASETRHRLRPRRNDRG